MSTTEMLFFLKKLISQFLYPLPLALILLTIGLLLLFLTRYQKLGKALSLICLCILLIVSYKPIALKFLYHLERQSLPLLKNASTQLDPHLPETPWIVVLSSGHAIDPALPATSQLSIHALARLVEGIRLQRLLPQSKLLLSGGPLINRHSNGLVMATAAQALGVSKDVIEIGPLALDTQGEAMALRERLGQSPFILVTSALHMKRAVGLFTKLGMQPVPSPAAYVTKDVENKNKTIPAPGNFFPQARMLEASTQGIHEYIGALWSNLRGRI